MCGADETGGDRRQGGLCLCPKNPRWEMSFIGFQAASDDQSCSVKELSLGAGEARQGRVLLLRWERLVRLTARRAGSLGTLSPAPSHPKDLQGAAAGGDHKE